MVAFATKIRRSKVVVMEGESKMAVMHRCTYLQGVRQRRFRLTRAVLGHPAGVIVEDVEGLRWSGARRDEGLDGGKRGGAGKKTGE